MWQRSLPAVPSRVSHGPTSALWSRLPTNEFLGSLAPAWDALNARLYRSHPLFDSRFVFPLVSEFCSRDLHVFVLGAPTAPEGVVLLEPHRLGIWRNFQRSQAEASPVMLAPGKVDLLGSLFSVLPAHVQAIDFLRQDPEYSPWPSAGLQPRRASSRHVLTAGIALDGRFDDYWAARPRRLRQAIARSIRRAAMEGLPLSMKVVEDVDSVVRAVDAFGAMESRGWKAAVGTALTPGDAQERFYSTVFGGFGSSGQALAYELHCGDTVIAQQLALAGQEMLILLKTTHDERFRRFSPGRVLDRELLKFEFERRRFPRIELYTNADELQLRWTTDSRWIEHVTCFRSGLAHRMHAAISVLRGRPADPTHEARSENGAARLGGA